MDPEFFTRQAAAVRAAYAAGLDCDVGAFSTEELTLLDRPAGSPWPYTALAVTFGTGTVVSVDPEYRSVAEEHLPEQHYAAAQPGYLGALVEEGARRGRSVSAYAPGLGFALGAAPGDMPVPGSLELREVDATWMNGEQAAGRFENGVGEPDRAARSFRNRFGVALFDATGEPVAVGGVFDTYGLHEIGVDVVRPRRGEGLGRLVVAAAARAILDRGGVPYYGCAATNLRSQRTALACGFVPVMSSASVF